MPKFYHQYPVVQIDPGALAKEVTLLQVLANQTNGDQLSQQVDASGNVQPAGDITARGVFVRPTDGTDSQEYTASGEALVLVTPLTSASTVTVVQPTGSNLHIEVDASALPTGAATAANQATEVASLASIDGKLTGPLSVTGPLTDVELRATAVPVSGPLTDTELRATPVPVSGPLTDTELRASAVPVSGTITVTGVATAANQATEIASLASIDGKLTAPLSVTGPLTDTELRASAVPVSAASLPLPTGAATEATLAAASAKLPATLGQKTMANSLAVVLASDQSPQAANLGRTSVQFVRNDYGSVNVTTAAYVALIASTSGAANLMEIFDSSGQTLKIAFGAAASEVDQFLVFPGGNGPVSISVPASTRVSIRAVSASATVGEISLNLYS